MFYICNEFSPSESILFLFLITKKYIRRKMIKPTINIETITILAIVPALNLFLLSLLPSFLIAHK